MRVTELLKVNLLSGVFSLGLGISSVMLTFVAIADGMTVGVIALLSALSAGSQMIARLALGPAFRKVPDRVVMGAALGTLALSMFSVLLLPGIAGLAIAQLCQGAARAGFWTGSQIHVLRVAPVPARGMARNQFVASLVGILGPITAGAFAEGDPRRAAWIVLCLGLTGGIGAALLTGLPVFDPPEKPEEGRVWRRPGVALSSIGSLASGAWYVATNTFVPVVLGNANWSNSAMGTVMGATNAAMLIGVLAAGQAKPARFGNIIVLGTVVSALGVGLLSVAGSIPGLTVVAFITSGVGTGALMTLCPTLAAQSVQPEERSQAVVTTGVYRSGALLGTPILVSVATLFMPVGAVMIVVAGLTGLPGVGAAIARAARPGT